VSTQRARSAFPAGYRSIHPDLPGLPWWGAILLAVGAAAAGVAIDAAKGGRDLSTVFAVLYVIGCLAAVLMVQQRGLFTAVVQPPLILFVAVPSAYYLFHHSEINGLKDILINCGYPLIERFLLMFLTSLAVLVVGIVRWFFGRGAATGTATPAAAPAAAAAGLFSALRANLSRRDNVNDGEDDAEPVAEEQRPRRPRRHTVDRPATAAGGSTARARRPAGSRETPSRSRHARPPMDDPAAAPAPPRRRRNTHARDTEDSAPPPPRRRRTPRDPEPRGYGRDYPREPERREYPREPWESRNREDRPRRNRYDGYDGYESFDSYEPPAPRSAGTNGTHLPYSNVRYRGSEDSEERAEYRQPPRHGRHQRPAGDWRYDN